MMSKAVAFALIAGGCVIAAGAGAFVAGRPEAPVSTERRAQPPQADPAAKPVAESEAIVTPPTTPATADMPVAEAVERPAETPRAAPATPRDASRARATEIRSEAPRSRPTNEPAAAAPAPAVVERTPAPEPAPVSAPQPAESAPEPVRHPEPTPAPEPQFDEVTLPASSVIGLQVTTPLSSERTQVEDRVEARVSRDVLAAGRLAIPAGSRVLGSVTVVERGGKMKERARLGVRFHTLVLADGREVPLRTEAIFREGDSPGSESARKIGGAAIGGAILGAIIGGGKGAAIGGATGAAGGTAAVMAGDRNPATLPGGTIVTVRLTAPVAIDVRRDK